MGKKIRFGGPGLPKGRHTWYMTAKPEGQPGLAQVRAEVGDEVEADVVLTSAGNPGGAGYYVDRGMAEYVDEETTEFDVIEDVAPRRAAASEDDGEEVT